EVGVFEQTFERVASAGFAGVDNVENSYSFTVSGIWERDLRTTCEKWTDGKAQRFDSFRRNTFLTQHAGGGFVGHDEDIAGRVKPCGADGNRIGDYCDEPKGTLSVPEQFGDEMAIDWVGGYDDVGIGYTQNFSQRLACFVHR